MVVMSTIIYMPLLFFQSIICSFSFFFLTYVCLPGTLYSRPGCPQTHSDLPVPPFQILGFKVCVLPPDASCLSFLSDVWSTVNCHRAL